MDVGQCRRANQLVAIFFALGYTACACVQFNDPDPLRWLLLYGLAAGLSIDVGGARAVARARHALAGVATVWAASLVPEVVGAPPLGCDEEEREVAGLLLVTIGMLWLARAARRSRSNRRAGDG